MEWISAPRILLNGQWAVEKAIQFSPDGKIAAIEPLAQLNPSQVRKLPGALIPGLVNAHCHLELSHLKGKIPRHTGMVGFISQLQAVRDQTSPKKRLQAQIEAANSMAQNGIVAVGDICNGTESLQAKKSVSGIRWHNFIEVFGLADEKAEEVLNRAKGIRDAFGKQNSSITLHAPYSCSPSLKKLVLERAVAQNQLQSIHLMESDEEMDWFHTRSGPFTGFFKAIGVEFDAASLHHPLDYLLQNAPQNLPSVLWVHNTQMGAEDIGKAQKLAESTYFVLCPNANEFIHHTAPNLSLFLEKKIPCAIGTDSLAGNDSLNLLDEIRTLQKLAPKQSPATWLTWATQNGAQALGMNEELGSFSVGKKPGILHLHPLAPENGAILPETTLKRII